MSPPLAVLNGLTQLLSFQASVYIRNNFRACIADFAASTIVGVEPWTGSTKPLPSSGESLEWMSPELLDPSRLEGRDPRPTKESDRFALGMVVYEVRVRNVLRDPVIVHNIGRCYVDIYHMTVGIERRSTMRY
jgi:hypothetical protein